MEAVNVGYCQYLENSLNLDLLSRDNQMAIDALAMVTFCEDGEDENPQADTLMKKISNGIGKILDRIIAMVENFVRAITNIGKKSMTPEEYMQTRKGSAEYHRRCGEIAKEIDAAFLQMRPIITMISNVTNMNPAMVEKLCDGLNRTLEKANWTEFAQGVIKKKVSHKKMQDGTYAKEIRGFRDRIKKSNDELSDTRKRIKDKERKLRSLNKVTGVFGTFTNKLFGSAPDPNKK